MTPSPALPFAGLDWGLLGLAVVAALPFKPWQTLRAKPLQNPWLACMVLMPWLWWGETLLPSGMALHLSGACLLALMVGWPLAVLSLVPIGVVGTVLQWWVPRAMGPGRATGSAPAPLALDLDTLPDLLWQQADTMVHQIVWMGLVPATLALALGLLMRRWLPRHLFVYILARGFIATALAIALSGVLTWWLGHGPKELQSEDWLLAWWLLGWGEATSTGMLVAIFVAFKPEWLLTYSDERYLPVHPR